MLLEAPRRGFQSLPSVLAFLFSKASEAMPTRTVMLLEAIRWAGGVFGTFLVPALDEVRVVVPGEVGSGTFDDFVDHGDVMVVEVCDLGVLF